jgi:PhoH-like ATPase
MGENTNVVIEGDVKQIDNHLCNEFNNGLNWIIKLMKGDHQYAHITMNCKRTRGKICDLVHKYKL